MTAGAVTTEPVCIGIDVGSITAKIVVKRGESTLYERYERHFSMVRQKALELICRVKEIIGASPVKIAISGSAGLGVAKAAGFPFVQEVYATAETVKTYAPETNCVVELGGEDAKVIFFDGGIDERMNGSCAGGTGAFIDQMATLLDLTAGELDELSQSYERIYPIASRCGVFAKTDIQPLLNQGARKADIAASIYQAVVNQTIAGLAQGRQIGGTVMFLGGPNYYCKGLRERFVKTLKLDDEHAIFPEYGRLAVAMGACLYAAKQPESYTYSELEKRLTAACSVKSEETVHARPLFADEAEYQEFVKRHSEATVEEYPLENYSGKAYLGIDCGSTTTKLTLISEDCRILYSYYDSNKGNPVEIVRGQLEKIYEMIGDRIQIAGSAVTGYGEELIVHAFGVDFGLVETMAHYNAARHFNPNVDFILDIGGQDIKCFKVHNHSIDSIMLNEACSSGCGSFLETFAKSMGYTVEEFAKLGLKSKAPVDLGSRCTVFMNSAVKQAQKDGADVTDISGGLSMSVVKNAIYKVIRAASPDELGREIVVQGGTFYNDAVLRSFELELGRNVIRPSIAGLMGAYGAALHARERMEKRSEELNRLSAAGKERESLKLGSSLISPERLAKFTHKAKSVNCSGCTNHCHLTVNSFEGGGRYISGNQCEKGLGRTVITEELPDLHQYKLDKLLSLGGGEAKRGTIGIPLALGIYELAPLWDALFWHLGFKVVFSGNSSKAMYEKGQYTIPSDTACYPAKIMHGHVETLVEMGVDAIFYPCLTYNMDEHTGSNHYNCPVVAYYPELLKSNVESLKKTKFLYPYLNINDEKELTKELTRHLSGAFGKIPHREVKAAVASAMEAYRAWMEDIHREGQRALEYARKHKKRIMVLCGRPYHVDAEVGHGIHKLAGALGFVVVSEDSVSDKADSPEVSVLNQWTYHARLYRAAEYVSEHDDCELVQLVSFGCGLDAITTDEVREILESHGKLYTQIKIDEITNLGAVKIRLRSLLGALEQRGKN
ncbi:MAG: 2-hydroxyacyl-CoA dehydratase [Lachnospiraceae bacterium]|nr:2-hydroxyacyl-CoA dehydratase [Lachnospiraceae bacterium]